MRTQCVTEKTVQTVLNYYQQQQRSTSGSEIYPGPHPVIKSKTKLKENGEYILSSLILKVNTKLGGVNCAIAAEHNQISKLRDNLLVIGADVTHPSTKDSFDYSICSVVASLDANYFRYVSVVKLQPKSKEEMIRQMREIMSDLLELYVRYRLEQDSAKNCPIDKSNPEAIYRLLPQHVLYYRDGIGDGQHDFCKIFEIENMHRTFKEFSKAKGFAKTYRPAVNTVIVMKRHNTIFKKFTDVNDDLNKYEREKKELLTEAVVSLSAIRSENDYQNLSVEQRYQIDENSETGRTFNINPGTLVADEKLVGSEREFYLCSHNCDKGTIRSTHYHILQNESHSKIVIFFWISSKRLSTGWSAVSWISFALSSLRSRLLVQRNATHLDWQIDRIVVFAHIDRR